MRANGSEHCGAIYHPALKNLYFCAMIILNETIIVDSVVHSDWLNWVKTVHIPAVMATGNFKSFRILHILNSPNEGHTYCVQYETDTIEQYQAYEQTVAAELKHIHLKKFENKLVLFESIMQQIHY